MILNFLLAQKMLFEVGKLILKQKYKLKDFKMNITDYSASMEAFKALCEEIENDTLIGPEECQYWVFERGYRAAIQELMTIMETGEQARKFASPKLQAMADKLIAH